MKSKTKWSKEPEKEDSSAAETYLSLIYDEKEAAKLVKKLKAVATHLKCFHLLGRLDNLNRNVQTAFAPCGAHIRGRCRRSCASNGYLSAACRSAGHGLD